MATKEEVIQYILSNFDAKNEEGCISIMVPMGKNISKRISVLFYTDWIQLSVGLFPPSLIRGFDGAFDLDIEKLLSVAEEHYKIGGVVKSSVCYELRHSIPIKAFSPEIFNQALDHTIECYRVMIKELIVHQ